jgi:hypothetical protein
MAETKTELSTPKAALSPAAAKAVLDRLGRIEASRVGDPQCGGFAQRRGANDNVWDAEHEAEDRAAERLESACLVEGAKVLVRLSSWCVSEDED